MSEYTTSIFGQKIGIEGNFANAASPIRRLNDEGEWETTQYQVADFRHNPRSAMEREIEEIIEAGGNDPADYADEIESALDDME